MSYHSVCLKASYPSPDPHCRCAISLLIVSPQRVLFLEQLCHPTIDLFPNSCQGVFEGMKASRTPDGRILLFRPEENAARMAYGAGRMCMPSPPKDLFLDAVRQTVLANAAWIPPFGKGSMYIRPLLIGTGAVLGLAPAPEYTFLVYVSPVASYFKVGRPSLFYGQDHVSRQVVPRITMYCYNHITLMSGGVGEKARGLVF
jgi:branched-subunit amino acid aminotransferase/4-amino-4-deoxychorismate lyase